jgi:hypothetical protein
MVAAIAQELGHWKHSHSTYSFLAMQVVLIPLLMLTLYRCICILQWIWELLDSQTFKASLQYLVSILLDNVHCKDSYIDVEVHDIFRWV